MNATIAELQEVDTEGFYGDPKGFIIIGSNHVPWQIPVQPSLGHARAVVDFARNPSYDLLTCVDLAYTLPVCPQDCGGLVFGDKCNVCGAAPVDTGCDDDHSQLGCALRGATHANISKLFPDGLEPSDRVLAEPQPTEKANDET